MTTPNAENPPNEKYQCANTGNPNNLYSNPTQNGHFRQGIAAETVRKAADDKWVTILQAAGANADVLNGKPGHPCPACGGKDRFHFTNREGSGSYVCRQCGGGKDGFSLVGKLKGWGAGQLHLEIAPRKRGIFGLNLSPASSFYPSLGHFRRLGKRSGEGKRLPKPVFLAMPTSNAIALVVHCACLYKSSRWGNH